MTRHTKTLQVTKAGIITALLVSIYLITCWIRIGESILQLTDGIYIWLVLLMPNELTMLFVGILYPMFIDMIGGGFIFIPLSIAIHVLMFLILRIKSVNKVLKIIVSSLLVMLYLPYEYVIFKDNDAIWSFLLKELIVDSIQMSVTIIFAMILIYQRNIKEVSKKIFTSQSVNKQTIRK